MHVDARAGGPWRVAVSATRQIATALLIVAALVLFLLWLLDEVR